MNSFKLEKKRKGFLLKSEKQSTDSIRITNQNFVEKNIIIKNNSRPIDLENCSFKKLIICHSSDIKIDNCRITLLEFDEYSQIMIKNSVIEFLSLSNGSKSFEIYESEILNLMLYYSFNIKVFSSSIQHVDNKGSSGCVFQDINISKIEIEKLLKVEKIKLNAKKTIFMNIFTIVIFLIAYYEVIQISLTASHNIYEFIIFCVIGFLILAAIFSILFIPFLKHNKAIKTYKKEQMEYHQNIET